MPGRTDRRGRRQGNREPLSLDQEYLEAVGQNDATEPAEPGAPRGPHRQDFGRRAWMEVEISAGGQEAFLTRLSFGGETELGKEDLLRVLKEQYLITSGINQKLVEQLAARAAAAPARVVREHFPIARGTPPGLGQDGWIEFKFLPDERTAPSGAEFAAALEQTALDEVLTPDLSTCLVPPGAELAILHPPVPGVPGRDIFGHPVTLAGAPAILRAGAYVRNSDNRYLSEIYGYPCVSGDTLSILPPVWVSPDRMEAYFVHFPQATRPPRPGSDWLLQVLQVKGVVHGIDDSTVERLCQTPIDPSEKRALCIARGTPPVHGSDTWVEYTFDPEKKAGKILDDGNIDLRERNAAVGVQSGQLLGQVIPATRGQPGMDVSGHDLSATNGRKREFKGGDHVRVECEEEAPKAFYAEIDGHVQIKGNTVQVNPVFAVGGDVDYETGNIDVPGDVQISGSVRSGFQVKAGGSVTVRGLVEFGAVINACGDIVVAQGIVGENTRIVALGDVETKFVQNSQVLARKNVTVGSYIFNGRVRAKGRIAVYPGGGRRGGCIVGGEVYATRGIEARRVGSPSADHTRVGISPDPESEARLAKLQKAVAFCDAGIMRLLRTLGLQTVDSARIRALIQRTPSPRRQFVIDAVRKLDELVKAREGSLGQQQQVEEQIDQSLREGEIAITGTTFANTVVRIGEDTRKLSDDLQAVVFFQGEDGIRYRPTATGSG